MSDPESHIAAWQAAGLIDGPTAARLRAAAAETASPEGVAITGAPPQAPVAAPPADVWARPSPPTVPPWTQGPPVAGPPAGAVPMPPASPPALAPGPYPPVATASAAGHASTLFGPPVVIGEMFAYLGIAFLLAAWFALLVRWTDGPGSDEVTYGVGTLGAAVALVGLAAWLGRGAERYRRGAGVALFVATGFVGLGVASLLSGPPYLDSHRHDIISAAAALAVASAFRIMLPAVMTQLGVLATATTLASTGLSWLRDMTAGPVSSGIGGSPSPAGVDPLVQMVVEVVLWLLVAVALGAVGLFESRGATPAADRRAAASRLWAGLTAIGGVASAVSRTIYASSFSDAPFSSARVLEPWIGDVAVLVLCAFLVERAFHRGTSVYIYPAAIGLIIAATDINTSYFSSTVEIGLFLEGGILLASGILADRLRRLIGARSSRAAPA